MSFGAESIPQESAEVAQQFVPVQQFQQLQAQVQQMQQPQPPTNTWDLPQNQPLYSDLKAKFEQEVIPQIQQQQAEQQANQLAAQEGWGADGGRAMLNYYGAGAARLQNDPNAPAELKQQAAEINRLANAGNLQAALQLAKQTIPAPYTVQQLPSMQTAQPASNGNSANDGEYGSFAEYGQALNNNDPRAIALAERYGKTGQSPYKF